MNSQSIYDDEIKIITQFKIDKLSIYKKAREITSDLEILIKIFHNCRLFSKIYNAFDDKNKHKIFIDLRKSLEFINEQDESILIQFTDLNIYCAFEKNQYLDFIKNLNDVIEDDGINVNLYQVVLAGKKQKLVFACTDAKYFEKLQNYAKDCFKETVNKSENQITINIITSNETEIMENYNKLYNFIHVRGDDITCESMKQIQPIQESLTLKFRKYSCNDTLTAGNLDELIKLLRSSHVIINAPINIINGNNNIIGNVNNNISNKETTNNWIVNNLPTEKEITTDYYNRYIAANKNGIGNSQFGKLVRQNGYKTVNGGKFRYWSM